MTSKEKKSVQLEDLTSRLHAASAVVFTDYRGFNVRELQEVRQRLREQSVQFMVMKNTLTRLALQKNVLPVDERILSGPTALALIGGDDVVGPAKVLVDLSKARKPLPLKGLLLGTALSGPQAVEMLAAAPPKERLYAQMVGGAALPLTGLLSVLQGTVSGLLYVLQACVHQLGSATEGSVEGAELGA
ncbi:MAG: 50S ribosomal protein L10 [Chloroflexi bacterium]|nr:50S ribosomal protein L10 [Chloroflexota bacterium]